MRALFLSLVLAVVPFSVFAGEKCDSCETVATVQRTRIMRLPVKVAATTTYKTEVKRTRKARKLFKGRQLLSRLKNLRCK